MKEQIIIRDGFDHGEIDIKPVDSLRIEWKVKATIELTISGNDSSAFKKELEELIEKYAL